MMAQWYACKKEAKDALLFFRLGDFYEAFNEDAVFISKHLNLTLTARQSIPMCGVPAHAAETYIDKLVRKGHRVAVAEQVGDPKETKGLVKREIVRIVTPATITSSQLVQDKENQFFASLYQFGSAFGLSYLDITTGEFIVMEINHIDDLMNELHRLRPKELLTSPEIFEARADLWEDLNHSFFCVISKKKEITPRLAKDTLLFQFDLNTLEALQARLPSASLIAAGSLLLYLKEELRLNLDQIARLQSKPLSSYMSIDRATMRHLEIINSSTDDAKSHSLLSFLDRTATPMGGRLLVQWLTHPLLDPVAIHERQTLVSQFLEKIEETQKIHALLENLRDLERLSAKVAAKTASPRDLHSLGKSLADLKPLKERFAAYLIPDIENLWDGSSLATTILAALVETPPLRIGEGDIFQEGYHQELDQLRSLYKESTSWIAKYQSILREETGIKTLKVGYTNAFGYYIEISKAQSEKGIALPSFFQRKQTLVNGERFITEDLKTFEHQILTAEEKSKRLEESLFQTLRNEIGSHASSIQKTAQVLAKLDLLMTFALIAYKETWVCPVIDASSTLKIIEGRHPIVEKAVGKSSFIGNDTLLSEHRQMMLITGPNMAGKSTYIRQVALIVILAQIGSYVPASFAHIGAVDQVFSRIGASDNLSKGESTFMVEMRETAHILTHATAKSLVLLDEIGRGTSTYDGIAIAWAVAEYLLTTPKAMAKTLFATHYWELTRLEAEFPTALNFQVAVEETSSGIVFLRKIIRGGADKSYGIHVAKLAGLPSKAIKRAEVMLKELEAKALHANTDAQNQLSLFPEEKPSHPILDGLKHLNLDTLTPLQALEKLFELKASLP